MVIEMSARVTVEASSGFLARRARRHLHKRVSGSRELGASLHLELAQQQESTCHLRLEELSPKGCKTYRRDVGDWRYFSFR